MTAIWGIVGISSVVIGAVLMVLGHLTGLEPFEAPSSRALGIMLLNGFLGTSISDYIWAQGVLMTSPLVANVSLNLTIPLSMVFDALVLKQHRFSWTAPLGAALVFAGVVTAAVDEAKSSSTNTSTTDQSRGEMSEFGSQPQDASWRQM